jgi:hypothetical protein
MHWLSAPLIAWLLLPVLIAYGFLIGTVRRFGLRFGHALLAPVLAAAVQRAFEVVFFGHRDQTLSCEHFRAGNAIRRRHVPSCYVGSICFRTFAWPMCDGLSMPSYR